MDEPRRALVISAHPDDIEFACAGAVATWVDDGWDVAYVIVTSGQRGFQDPRTELAEAAALRERESIEAAAAVGVTNVTFLGYMDGELLVADPLALRKDLSRQFRRHRPHRLVAMDPELLPRPWFVNHPDHRTVAVATLDITVTGGTTGAIHPELELDEGLPPWRGLEEVWLAGPRQGPVVVDISSVIDRRIESLLCHRSQTADWDVATVMRARLAQVGAASGMEYGETYRVIDYRRG